jgi:hypothetical protein
MQALLDGRTLINNDGFDISLVNDSLVVRGGFNSISPINAGCLSIPGLYVKPVAPAPIQDQAPAQAGVVGHVHAKSMVLYAEDAATHAEPWLLWEHKNAASNGWKELFMSPSWLVDVKYRRKIKTIKIGDHEVPEPARFAPDNGTEFYVVCTTVVDDCFSKGVWSGTKSQLEWLRNGLIQLTEEGFKLHRDALLSFSKQK